MEGIARHASNRSAVFAAPAGGAMVLRGRYPAFEGSVANGPHLRIGLCVGNAATLKQKVDGVRLEGAWRTGSIVVTPPGGSGTSSCSTVDMIGLAVIPTMLSTGSAAEADDLLCLNGRFFDDPLLAAVTTALYCEAEVHGASTAFFEHGVALILRRFGELGSGKAPAGEERPLSPRRLDRVRGYVESRLSDDISVAEMAAVAGMDPSGFTRALKARTGQPPYAWLTQMRMERAGELLIAGWKVMLVANTLGYTNSSKFAAAFRRAMGVNPTEWRRRRMM